MNINTQKELIQAYKEYQNTDKDIIKANIKQLIDESGYKLQEIADNIGASIHTIHQMRKFNVVYRPDFITVMLICDMLNIPITETLQPIKVNITEPETKWTITAKTQYIKDFDKIGITAITHKYSITERTAGEYYKNFKRDLENEV